MRSAAALSIWLVAIVGPKNNGDALSAPEPRWQFACDRRSALQTAATTGLVVAVAAGNVDARAAFAVDEEDNTSMSFQTYKVTPDAKTLNPQLTSQTKQQFLERVASCPGGAVWLGEHHNSAADHNLQADIVRQIASMRRDRNIAVGLEQVQVMFQPVLDDYVAGKISLEAMRQAVQWDKRWMWSFDGYRPVFEAARDLRIPLIALNVNSEDLVLVEKGGLPGLPRDRLNEYIADASGFASFAKNREFTTYVDYVIQPSYELHQAMGLLKNTLSGEKMNHEQSFRNFLSGRILWDEAMATNAYKWTQRNKGGLLLGLVGADHVKFRNGIPGRYARMAGENGGDCISVMLNPTLIDTRPSGTVESTDASMSSQNPDAITLQLRYLKDNVELVDRALPESTGGVLPLADYLIIG